MIFVQSPHYNERPDLRVWVIVLHASANSSLEGLVRWFQLPESRVSAHYCIGKDGSIVQMVGDGYRAWHAGVSKWRGHSDVNDFSLGIELVNLNDGNDPYPGEQQDVLIALLVVLCREYGIGVMDIVGHWEVNQGKNDPQGLDLGWVRGEVERCLVL